MKHEDLIDFAKRQVNAEAYPTDEHRCALFQCGNCGTVTPLSVFISYSEACDERRPAQDFAGTVYGTCEICGDTRTLFSIKRGAFSEKEHEHPICDCGSEHFYVCLCERYEGEEGLKGFFDEGVIAAKCRSCGEHRALLFTD
jgi:hypothetical protein